MKGSIRFFGGLLIVLGTVGTMDYDPNADLFASFLIGAMGLVLMNSGAKALGEN